MLKRIWKDWKELCVMPPFEFVKRHKVLYGVMLLVFSLATIVGVMGFMQLGAEGQRIQDTSERILKMHEFLDREDEG